MTGASDLVVRAEGLGKRYLIGHEARHEQRQRYVALRDVIAERARDLWRHAAARGRGGGPGRQRRTVEEFWALRGLDFEVRRGEVLGIIGRNGAGKSTLLKILSRITEPSEGQVTIRGRVASLLEVGTGFHPELTGRENIFLNGAILGMTRAEIRRKFDAIVAFAEIEKFLDTPVKRYSSGMYVRLAFAVAAHLEPDIIVIDEVLAVGDAEFQRRCLGKMSEVARGGRTVLFVSHNMGAIRSITSRSLLLDRGRICLDAPTAEVVDRYLAQVTTSLGGGDYVRDIGAVGDQPFFVRRVTTRRTAEVEPRDAFDADESLTIRIDYVATRRVAGLYGYINLVRPDGTVVYEGDSRDGGMNPLDELVSGEGVLCIAVPPRVLGSGTYRIYLSFAAPLDAAGPDIDAPGLVGEFVVNDGRTLRGNGRNGYLSTIFGWTLSPAAAMQGETVE